LINANKTSSAALCPTFPKILLFNIVKIGFIFVHVETAEVKCQFIIFKLPLQNGSFTLWRCPFVCLFVCLSVASLQAAGAYRVGHAQLTDL